MYGILKAVQPERWNDAQKLAPSLTVLELVRVPSGWHQSGTVLGTPKERLAPERPWFPV